MSRRHKRRGNGQRAPRDPFADMFAMPFGGGFGSFFEDEDDADLMGFGFPAPRAGRASSGGRARGGDPFDMLMSSMVEGMRGLGGGVGDGGPNTVVQTWSSFGGGGSFREERVVRTSRGGVEETVRTVRDSEEGEEHTYRRVLGGKAHTVTRKVDALGRESREERLHAMDFDELEEFEQEWASQGVGSDAQHRLGSAAAAPAIAFASPAGPAAPSPAYSSQSASSAAAAEASSAPQHAAPKARVSRVSEQGAFSVEVMDEEGEEQVEAVERYVEEVASNGAIVQHPVAEQRVRSGAGPASASASASPQPSPSPGPIITDLDEPAPASAQAASKDKRTWASAAGSRAPQPSVQQQQQQQQQQHSRAQSDSKSVVGGALNSHQRRMSQQRKSKKRVPKSSQHTK